jgi:CHAT domain-containing protein/tetratricopeptide (TPR) repeat protein
MTAAGSTRVVAACVAVIAALMLESGALATAGVREEQAGTALAALIDEGDRLVAARRYDEAATVYDSALAQARESVREPELARALVSRADLRYRQRQIPSGLADAREALEIFERLDARRGVARAHLTLGLLESAGGDRAGARASIERAIEDYTAIKDGAGAALAWSRLASLIRDGGTTEDRLQVLRGAADSARAAGLTDAEAYALHQSGDVLFNVGRYEESMAMLQAAARIYEATGATVDLGTVHNSLGRLYRAHGRLDEALREQQAALALHRRGDDPLMLLQSLNAVGVTYQAMGYLEEARSYLMQALAVEPSTASPNARDFLEANLAGLQLGVGEFATAAQTLEQVLARGADAYPSRRNQQLSYAYLKLGRLNDAMQAANRAIELCGDSKDTCATAYSMRAEAQAALGNRVEGRADSRAAVDLIEQTRARLLPSDANRREFETYARDVYSVAIGLSVADDDPRAGLEAAELARARAFLDLLKSRALAAPEPGAAAALRRGVQDEPPLQASAPAATADELVATTARLSSTMVAFWVGTDETFAWVIDASGRIASRRIAVSRATLTRLVRETQPFGAAAADGRRQAPPSLTSGDAAWRRLHALLIAPIQPLLPTTPGALLTIVPHDVLNRLSFAALKSPRGRYLLEDFTLHYAPAGALLQFTAARRRPGARDSGILLVADPALPRRSSLDGNLPRLPGTRTETSAIARYVSSKNATLLQGAAATEAQVRELAGDRAVLHFATHAVIREDQPFESHLVLAASGAAAAGDGVLTAAEIYGLRLHADLIVLSACQSAAGGVAGDAIATFTRAFLYAGTASLLASVWDVADEPTNQLLPAFYRAWLGGADKAAALRRAQLQLLADLRGGRVRVATELGPVALSEHPVFWAGFLLFGEPR